uniref:Zinc finger GRF-type domain-containing protein n=1 Tax=Lactuca sativa TaxID=4236 RepID=A0A9R1X4D6_LACSA|nr:hypothetical protein LSAT_V11C700355590 [Lactuca sativa]
MVMCFCRKWVIVRTSWTNNNPGRRFWGCPDPFIGWYDEPMCAHSKVIIPGLLRTINKLRIAVDDIKDQASKHEKEVVKIKEQATMLKYYLVYSWIFFVVVLNIVVMQINGNENLVSIDQLWICSVVHT